MFEPSGFEISGFETGASGNPDHVLLAYGPFLLSRAGTPYLSVGTLATGSALQFTDGILGHVTVVNEITAAFAVDLGSAKSPDIVGVLQHNITSGIVRFQGSNVADFSALVLDEPVGVQETRLWVDLRSLGSHAARYWRLLVTANANALRLGELVLATVVTMPGHQWDYTEATDYAEYSAGTTDYGVLVRRKQGFAIRSRSVRWAGPDRLAETLLAVSDYAGRYPGPVIWVPDDRDADIWMVDWPDDLQRAQVIDNRQELRLVLQEQSPGA